MIKKKKNAADDNTGDMRDENLEDKAENTSAPADDNSQYASDTEDVNFSAEEAGDTEAKAKQPTQEEMLKAYLEQSLRELKKQKDENEDLKKRLETAESNTSRLNDRLNSLNSEYENYRRRTQTEKESLGTDASIKAVKTLLPVLDNLERAMPFAESHPDSFKKGVDMTLKQLIEAFASMGVTEITAKGAEFDPNVHEAVMHIEDESFGDSEIVEVFQKGYMLGEKVIRPSCVKVAN